MAASRIVRRNVRIMATNATEIAVTSSSRKAWRNRVSVIGRPDRIPEVLTVGTEGALCPRALVGDEGLRRAAPRAGNVGPRRGVRKQSHGVVPSSLETLPGSGVHELFKIGHRDVRDGHVQNGTDPPGHTT